MINEEIIEKLTERLVERIEKANEYFLEGIGKYIKEIRELSPSKAHQLIQMLKYGSNYNEIIRKISKMTTLNVADIDAIFSNYAKKDQLFYEKFYRYRNVPFLPYEANIPLKTQTMALANMIKNEMYNYTRSNVLGYTIRDINGKAKFFGLREVYNKVLDDALLNVSQGKDTFGNAMSGIIKDIGSSGLKTLDYQSGRAIRLDSAVRMHLSGALNQLHNENQKIYGSEFNADGYEISVHENPAPDHEEVQGRQFSIAQYELLQNGGLAEDYKGKHYTLDHDGKNGYRPIGTLNCQHKIFPIILGVSEPEYSDKQLKEIIKRNDKGFNYEDKHYTMYEGTQIQRQLEREIRKQKDIQIIARASGDKDLVGISQGNITILTNKYNKLSKISGLPTKIERLKVSGYRRIKS